MLLSTLLALALLAGCCKEKAEKNPQCLDTFVFWGGDPAVDGTGWYLADTRSGPKFYRVENLPDAYQSDSLAVHACVIALDKKAACECTGVDMRYYKITAISKR